jgi:arginyl-tRNA synthetase
MSDPLFMFQEKAEELVFEALQSMGLAKKMAAETPPEGMGDFAFPCFNLAKELKKAPKAIAAEMASNIKRDQMFSKVEAKGPYVNFHMNNGMLAKVTIDSIMRSREDYGSHEPNGKRLVLEHTSANPNGPLHVGRARNPIIGDTLARILKKCGYDVTTEFYVDDMGKQQVTLTWGADNLKKTDGQKGKADHDMVWYYQEASRLMESEENVKNEVDRMLALYEKGDEDIARKVQENCKKVMDGMIRSLSRLDIHFDSLAWESKYLKDGSVARVIEKLRALECTSEENGALYLDISEFGITGQESKFFLTRGDGSSLYSTRDVAYHLDKLARHDVVVDVLGEDHRLKARVVGICLKLMGSERLPEIVFYAFVSLPEGKMSTRAGRVVYLDDLMEEAVELARKQVYEKRPDLDPVLKHGIAEAVGLGAIRFNIIRVQAEKPIVFKWEEAMNFEGNSAPFVQYSHARASSILRKATSLKEFDVSHLTHQSEIALVKALARFPSVIFSCGKSRIAHPVALYCYEVAALFNQFYRDCPVLTTEKAELRNARLALVEVSKWVLANSLDTLGIVAPEEM